MNVHYHPLTLPSIPNAVVTTGSFDGVHVGHKVIIKRLNNLAASIQGESVLVTFDPHPRKVLYPETAGKDLRLITSLEEKIYLLEKTGLNHLVVLPFTLEFAKTTSVEFVENFLLTGLGAKIIVVGFNHHFGHNREGDYTYLYKLSRDHRFEVEEIPEQDIMNESVSSTKIRKALTEGNIQRANAYLDHYYLIKGGASLNPGRSNDFGVQVYNLHIIDPAKLVPSDGVYAVNIFSAGQPARGMLSICSRLEDESSDPLSKEIEFIPVDDVNLSEGEKTMICFHKRLRPSMSNERIAGVRAQVLSDIDAVKELIY